MKLKIGDYIVFLYILFISIFLLTRLHVKNGNLVKISVDGKEYEYSLSENKIYEVKGKIGITKIEVKDGQVRIIDSPCRNKTCVHQGWGMNIICLPNDVVVSVLSGDKYDAIAQ